MSLCKGLRAAFLWTFCEVSQPGTFCVQFGPGRHNACGGAGGLQTLGDGSRLAKPSADYKCAT